MPYLAPTQTIGSPRHITDASCRGCMGHLFAAGNLERHKPSISPLCFSTCGLDVGSAHHVHRTGTPSSLKRHNAPMDACPTNQYCTNCPPLAHHSAPETHPRTIDVFDELKARLSSGSSESCEPIVQHLSQLVHVAPLLAVTAQLFCDLQGEQITVVVEGKIVATVAFVERGAHHACMYAHSFRDENIYTPIGWTQRYHMLCG